MKLTTVKVPGKLLAAALAVVAIAAEGVLAQEVQPRYAGVDPNLGPAAVAWSSTSFTVGGMTFAGFDEGEETVIRGALALLPPSLTEGGIYAEKGGADSYTPASYSGNVIILGENQIGGDFLAGSLVHELAHSWAQRDGPDQKRYLFWSFGNTVGLRFANTEDAFVNEYARSCVQAAREALGFLHLASIDPRRVAVADGLFEEDFANTAHEHFLSVSGGGSIHWIDFDGTPLADPAAGDLKLARMRELLDW